MVEMVLNLACAQVKVKVSVVPPFCSNSPNMNDPMVNVHGYSRIGSSPSFYFGECPAYNAIYAKMRHEWYIRPFFYFGACLCDSETAYTIMSDNVRICTDFVVIIHLIRGNTP